MEQYTYIAHYGIKDMKWGVRRFQNEDGSLTPAGRLRYGVDAVRSVAESVGSLAKTEISRKGSVAVRSAKRRAVDARLKGMHALSDAKSALSVGSRIGLDEARFRVSQASKSAKKAKDRFEASQGYAAASAAFKTAASSLSGGAKEFAFGLGSMLGTQGAEAERIMRYCRQLDSKRALRVKLKSDAFRRDYEIRKNAAQNFVRAKASFGISVAEASKRRFELRNGSFGPITSGLYDEYTKFGLSNIKRDRDSTEFWRKIASGRY